VTVFRNVNAVEPTFLGGESRFRRVDFEIPAFAVEVCETNGHRAFDSADGDAFIAQRDDTQDGIAAETNEIAGVDLYFDFTVGARADCVAFDKRLIQLGRFPVLTVIAFQVNLAVEHADARDASFHVVIVLIVIVAAGYHGS
jgi:hypothetical protein